MAFNCAGALLGQVEEWVTGQESRIQEYLQPRLPPHVQAMKPRPPRRPKQQSVGALSSTLPPTSPLQAAQLQRAPTRTLTDDQVSFFKAHGYVKLPGCFTSYQCSMLMGDLWQRMGVSPDKRTWHRERVDVPAREDFDLKEFAPKAWAAICELLGGEDRLQEDSDSWNDSFIVNLGTPEGEGRHIEPDGWHVDGDFFAHFLDSPEQALLVLPLFTDVHPGGGATMLCPAALTGIAQFLYDHPEGVSPDFVLRSEDPCWNRKPERWRVAEFVERMGPRSFVEATGNAGDVYFLHPLMAHSASNNRLRQLRVINNPNVSLKRPFCFDRDPSVPFSAEPSPAGGPNGGAYSVVELTTLNFLGAERLGGWRITGTRDRISKEQRRWQKEEELERIRDSKPWFVAGRYLSL